MFIRYTEMAHLLSRGFITNRWAAFYSFTDTLKQNNILIKNEIVGYELVPCTASLARKIASSGRYNVS